MPSKITTEFGHAAPPASRHSVTVHMSGWDNVEKYGSNSAAVIAGFKNAYPRMKPHKDIADLATSVLTFLGLENHGCQLFASWQSAIECVDYATSPRRDNGADKKPLSPQSIKVEAFVAQNLFFAVVYPIDSKAVLAGFWATPGVGVSSRFAESNLRSLDKLRRCTPSKGYRLSRTEFDGNFHTILRERIIQYLNRASLSSGNSIAPAPGDVYFFPTGMASVYKPHTYFARAFPGKTVLFGMAFMNTLTLFEEFGSGYKFFGNGERADMDALAAFLDQERKEGRRVQAIWAEFPANPLLLTPDISSLRALADEYDTILAIDDTIGSWANVDITGVADIIVTSLTKSFNGYADAIAGSVVLNPRCTRYGELKTLFDEHYIPELYYEDAEAIERNSRDYLARSYKLNHNARSLVAHLESMAHRPDSAIRRVFYPSINESGK